jgi:hypothetical protein
VETLDPLSAGNPPTVDMDASGGGFEAVACPADTQCIAVDDGGNVVNFDPTDLTQPTPVSLDPNGGGLTGVACPSTTECVITDVAGDVIDYDPATGVSDVEPVDSGSDGLADISCPSTTQCTAIDYDTGEVTFDPASPGTPTPQEIDPSGGETSVACPSTTACVVVDDSGDLIGFDPTATSDVTTVSSGNSFESVACASLDSCVAGDGTGNVASFSLPLSSSSTTTTGVDQAGNSLTAAACTADACFLANDLGEGFGEGSGAEADELRRAVRPGQALKPTGQQATSTSMSAEAFPASEGTKVLPCNPDRVYGAAAKLETNACDMQSGTPLVPSSTGVLPDGGTLAKYSLPSGGTVEVPSTPHALNLTEAPASVQAAYGAPAAPAPDTQAYAQWAHEVGHWQDSESGGLSSTEPATVPASTAATASDAVTPDAEAAPMSGELAGWDDYEPNGTFVQSQAIWDEPQLLPSTGDCGTVAASFWTGLQQAANEPGYSADSALEQAGTQAGPGRVPAQAFFELANGDNIQYNWNVAGGDKVVVRPKHRVVSTVEWKQTGSDANTYLVTISGRYHLSAIEKPGSTAGASEGPFDQALTVVENTDFGPSIGLLHFSDVGFTAEAGRANAPYAAQDAVPWSTFDAGDALNPDNAQVSGLSPAGKFHVKWVKTCS